jgi:hypothetical protein
MDFTRRKLPKEAATNLRICPVASVKPYALMLAPVYVLMRANEKFVSIKGPLDFFTPEELERLKSFEQFYLPEFVDFSLLFRQSGRQVRSLAGWTPLKDGREELPPSPYEMSDAVLRMVGPLWGLQGESAVIEPFFAAVFTNELCNLIPTGLLVSARDRDTESFERAILRSGWAVFLAVHLGYCDLDFLNRLRDQVFVAALNGQASGLGGMAGEVEELVDIVFESLSADPRQMVRAELFDQHASRAAQKLSKRMQRARAMIPAGEPVATIFGERGFTDVA